MSTASLSAALAVARTMRSSVGPGEPVPSGRVTGTGLHGPCSIGPAVRVTGRGMRGTGLPATVRAAQSLGDSACGSLLRKRGCTLCLVNTKRVARLCGTEKHAGAWVDAL